MHKHKISQYTKPIRFNTKSSISHFIKAKRVRGRIFVLFNEQFDYFNIYSKNMNYF